MKQHCIKGGLLSKAVAVTKGSMGETITSCCPISQPPVCIGNPTVIVKLNSNHCRYVKPITGLHFESGISAPVASSVM